jgi:hypothetical protein
VLVLHCVRVDCQSALQAAGLALPVCASQLMSPCMHALWQSPLLTVCYSVLLIW